MQRLVKNQYEAIAMLIQKKRFNAEDGALFNYSKREIDHAVATLDDLSNSMAYWFSKSDPNFKRSEFIKQCGIEE